MSGEAAPGREPAGTPTAPRVPVPRLLLEWAARLAALAIVGWLLLASLRAEGRPIGIEEGTLTRQALAFWTAGGVPEILHLRIPAVPDPVERAWSVAFTRAGTAVTWSGGEGLVPIAVAGSAVADPRGGIRVHAMAAGARMLALSDDAGLIDSLELRDGSASALLPGGIGAIATAAGDRAARMALPEEATLRAVLVLGAAGWESRFIIAALEERGWRVAARLGIAPGVAVTQGDAALPDTARHSAVVVVDSTVDTEAAAVARFVRRGGGLVLVGSAAAIPGLRALAPAASGARIAPDPGNPPDSAPRSALGARPLLRLTSDAVPLERRGTLVMGAARRVGAGRVVQIAYDDSWRWRMGAGDGAVEAHREWWSRVVSGVAYAPLLATAAGTDGDTLDAAPYTRLVAGLGPPGAAPARAAVAARLSPWWVMLALCALLLGEWGSRRLRGAR